MDGVNEPLSGREGNGVIHDDVEDEILEPCGEFPLVFCQFVPCLGAI